MDKTIFTGNSHITLRWDETQGRWVFTPMIAGEPLTAVDMVALGLPAYYSPTTQRTVTPFSQRDPRWNTVRLGASTYTLGSAGCAVTACAMLLSATQTDVTPRTLCEWLNAHDGFTSGGLLYWAKVAEYGRMRFVGYQVWRGVAADVGQLRAALAYGPQVVQVDFHPGGALDSHFVLATEMAGEDVAVVDPWTGQAGRLLELYGQTGWTLARAVYALAEFRTS